ncbi:hypothetical protein N7453_011365 [Penicillium expansum]|nr:hypothetical protein N7453_011365 [Penicillium expansum]
MNEAFEDINSSFGFAGTLVMYRMNGQLYHGMLKARYYPSTIVNPADLANIIQIPSSAYSPDCNIGDKSRLDRYVRAEIERPSPRKTLNSYSIYRSRPLEPASQLGRIQLGDFGSAEPGDAPRNGQLFQPSLYRAPEVMLGKEWNYPADISNLGVWAWCAFEGSPLFICEEDDDAYSVSTHLAQITVLLGPPPPEFIEPDTMSAEYFDVDG